MNPDDWSVINEQFMKLEAEGIPVHMEAFVKDMCLKPLPEVIAVLIAFKMKNKAVGDLLFCAVFNSAFLTYCSTIDESLFLLASLKDSMYKFDKVINTN